MLALTALVLVCLPRASQMGLHDDAPGQEDPLAAAIEVLREGRYSGQQTWGVPNPYFDPMHGRPNECVVTLLGAREAATALVCGEIEWLDERQAEGDEPHQHYREILYYVLGQAKDPASIPWLEQRLENHRREVFEYWAPRWRRGTGGPGASERVWLSNPEGWGWFLRNLATMAEGEGELLPALAAVGQWAYDAPTVEMLEEIRQRPELSPKTTVVVEFYIQKRGGTGDGDRLREAIDAIRSMEGGDDWLHRYARVMRHVAFVPWLVSIVEQPKEGGWQAYRTLEEITLASDIELHEWQAWWSEHRGETRRAWIDSYFDALLRQYEADPGGAAARFADDRWGKGDDLLFLHSIRRVAELAEMHEALSDLVSWSEHPSIRADLQGTLDAIAGSGGWCQPLIDPGGATGPDAEATAGRVWLDDLPYVR